jgi:hypothetical protein
MDKERAVVYVAEPPVGVTSASMAATRDAPPPPPAQPQPREQEQPQQQQASQAQPHPLASHGHSRVSSMGAPEHQPNQPYRPPGENELGNVLVRLEQQVAFNYSMIQGHHADIQTIKDQVGRFQNEMRQVIRVMEDMRKERLPPQPLDPSRYDPADVQVLANQIANVTNKANEVDMLKVTIEMMSNQLKRLESGSAAPVLQPAGDAGRPDPQYGASRAQQLQAPPGHPPSSTRPGAALPSEHGRHPGHPPPTLESQHSSGFRPAHEHPYNPTEQAQQAARQPNFRASESHPPPTGPTGWRSAESFQPPGGPSPPAHSQPLRSHPPESEPQATGWAAVNLGQAAKRPLDEHQPQHDSQPGSPKRPKLAPLKPRSSFGDEHRHQSPYAQPALVEAHQPRGRISSNDVPLQPHPQMTPAPTPAPAPVPAPVPAPAPGQAAGNSYRFITSTGQPDNQEHWRGTEGDYGTRFEHTTGGRGRGRGTRGGRRGGRGRGGRSSSGPVDGPPAAPDAPTQEHVHNVQVPPEWRDNQWVGTQQAAASNGHYQQHAYSPIDPARQPAADPAVHAGAPQHGMSYPPAHEHEFSATPVGSNVDPYSMANDLDSANRKTRTKPIRNSDGVLIRKDGRPDMRSVSSANNLRKVHAKKEAEKAEMEGRTPTSGRSLAPANSSSLSEDEGMEEGDYNEPEGEMDRDRSECRNGSSGDAEVPDSLLRHRELMNRMFVENEARFKGTAQAYFPRNEGSAHDVKREDQESKEREARWRGIEDTTMWKTERETPQRQSLSAEQASREQTSVEATSNVAEPAVASKQSGRVADVPSTESAVPRPLSAAAGERSPKDTREKDSTQRGPSAEGVVIASAGSTAATAGVAASDNNVN